MMRTAAATASRMTGSPRRPTIRLRKPGRSVRASSSTSTSLPVSIRPQVEALTNRLSDWPRWDDQSAEPIFSAIRRSRVSSSGVRRRASARHIRARPSRVPSENSCRKLSTTPCFLTLARARSTRPIASPRTAARSVPSSGMRASRARTVAVSSANLPWSSASQSWDRATGGETCAFMARVLDHSATERERLRRLANRRPRR